MKVEVLPALPNSACSACRPIHAECRRLTAQLKQAEAENRRLCQELEDARRQNKKLKAQIEEAQRAAKRQASPFSKGKKDHPKKPGRKGGANYGRKGHKEPPKHVDETIDVPPPERCPYCGGEVEPTEGDVLAQYQTEIPPVRPHVTQFNARGGTCKSCERHVRGRHPRQNSEASGAAAAHLGPRALAVAAQMNKELGLSLGKVQVLFATLFQISITRGGLAQAIFRSAQKLAPTYTAAIAAVAGSRLVVPDETGWRVDGELAWLWVFATEELTVYSISDGRSFEDACRVLPSDYAGKLARDGWSIYRQFLNAEHQTCDGHLLRRCEKLLLVAERGAARVPHLVRALIVDALDLRDRRDAGEISPHGLDVAIGRLEARADRLLAWQPTDQANRRLLKHLRNERDALFTFLRHPWVPATSNLAEQEIRPAVVTRKVCGGNRTWNGASSQEVHATVLRSARRQALDPIALYVPVLCSPVPVLAPLRGLQPLARLEPALRSAAPPAVRATLGGLEPVAPVQQFERLPVPTLGVLRGFGPVALIQAVRSLPPLRGLGPAP